MQVKCCTELLHLIFPKTTSVIRSGWLRSIELLNWFPSVAPAATKWISIPDISNSGSTENCIELRRFLRLPSVPFMRINHPFLFRFIFSPPSGKTIQFSLFVAACVTVISVLFLYLSSVNRREKWSNQFVFILIGQMNDIFVGCYGRNFTCNYRRCHF